MFSLEQVTQLCWPWCSGCEMGTATTPEPWPLPTSSALPLSVWGCLFHHGSHRESGSCLHQGDRLPQFTSPDTPLLCLSCGFWVWSDTGCLCLCPGARMRLGASGLWRPGAAEGDVDQPRPGLSHFPACVPRCQERPPPTGAFVWPSPFVCACL